MNDPRTEAGKRLLADFFDQTDFDYDSTQGQNMRRDILAIEAEAAVPSEAVTLSHLTLPSDEIDAIRPAVPSEAVTPLGNARVDLFATALQETGRITVHPGDGPAAFAAAEAIGLDSFVLSASEAVTLTEAAMALFNPMEHGSPSQPNEGHTPETHCAACVAVRAKRTQAIRRALVAIGAMPSIDYRAVPSEAVTPLDPERLARALVIEGYPWEEQSPPGWRNRAEAQRIIAEYAALPTDRPTEDAP